MLCFLDFSVFEFHVEGEDSFLSLTFYSPACPHVASPAHNPFGLGQEPQLALCAVPCIRPGLRRYEFGYHVP